MKTYHVYGGMTFVKGQQTRAVVACTRAELPGIIGGKAAKAYAKNYWSITGNQREVDTARSRPGVMFYHDKSSDALMPIEG